MPLFKKPAHMKYTDMCIYVDNTIYKENLTEEEQTKCFEYLYHIAKMLAYKAKYFNNAEYYEDFAAYFATNVYLRLTSEKQNEIDEKTGEFKLTKIKSCLNYMKNVGYLRKIEFEQNFYSQALSQSTEEIDKVYYNTPYSFADKLSESLEDISMADFNICLGDICKTARNYLKRIPYKYNSLAWNNIYLSCILTLLSSITLPNKTIDRVNNLKHDIQNRPHAADNLYKDTPRNLTILYHVDKEMTDYIWILTQEIKHELAKDLSLTLHTYVPVTQAFDAIALADINLEEYTGYGD